MNFDQVEDLYIFALICYFSVPFVSLIAIHIIELFSHFSCKTCVVLQPTGNYPL